MSELIEFEDNSIKITAEINAAVLAAMHEASGIIEAEAKRNTRADSGQTRGAWNYQISQTKEGLESQIGNPLENAVWEEFGTGEYAIEGNGRKGGWYVPEEKLTEKAKKHMQKVVGKDGKVYYFTKGKKPQRTLEKAFTSTKREVQTIFNEALKEIDES